MEAYHQNGPQEMKFLNLPARNFNIVELQPPWAQNQPVTNGGVITVIILTNGLFEIYVATETLGLFHPYKWTYFTLLRTLVFGAHPGTLQGETCKPWKPPIAKLQS